MQHLHGAGSNLQITAFGDARIRRAVDLQADLLRVGARRNREIVLQVAGVPIEHEIDARIQVAIFQPAVGGQIPRPSGWIVPDEKACLARQRIESFQHGAAIHIQERNRLRLNAGFGPGAQHKPVARERSTKAVAARLPKNSGRGLPGSRYEVIRASGGRGMEGFRALRRRCGLQNAKRNQQKAGNWQPPFGGEHQMHEVSWGSFNTVTGRG
jgi:hypothetical protein